ncbi:SEC-C domain-containing protein [Catenovulum sp. SM1970]|uniref:PBPRA1643 family SWIM/SEC-C metal-binding motif protein n=1 Tax=Marinifaba aquimaris TaxID=2741323 RepID=UPI0015724566|nr:PBPRA1643 family SWIM/SEC-C metal-binding motif protein [Marinifaba aquimaris]NTS77782.1 SEC-C domain-containing protein [Marinifaba aquimaris]
MSKFFYKGRITKKGQYGTSGYNPKNVVKLGTKLKPLTLLVNSQERKLEIQAMLSEHELVADIQIDSEKPEDIVELEAVLNKPKSETVSSTPKRNAPCSCGSGKKYKKCCGA